MKFGRVTFFALVLVAAGALGRGPEFLLRAGKANVLLVLLVKPFGGTRVPRPLVLAHRIDAGPAATACRQLFAVYRRRTELVRRWMVQRPGRLVVGPVPVRSAFQLAAPVVIVTRLKCKNKTLLAL